MNRVVLVTGGSRGIGAATARLAAARGYAVCVIYTEMHASGGEPNRVERVKTLVPMKRGGTSEEVAHAILWLMSDESSYTTGSFIDVAGGK
jgi:NAD(P)-dependent dehydrogenase (short-subunit alcohol dehydrogenase family)